MSLGKSTILLTVSPVSDLKRANTVCEGGADILQGKRRITRRRKQVERKRGLTSE